MSYSVMSVSLYDGYYNLVVETDKKIILRIKVTQDILETYEGVSPQHYVDGEDIIVVRDMFRTVVVDDNNVYKRASQMDYDRWMRKKFPESTNALMYDCITKIKASPERGVEDVLSFIFPYKS
jgi:hypothetical protein